MPAECQQKLTLLSGEREPFPSKQIACRTSSAHHCDVLLLFELPVLAVGFHYKSSYFVRDTDHSSWNLCFLPAQPAPPCHPFWSQAIVPQATSPACLVLDLSCWIWPSNFTFGPDRIFTSSVWIMEPRGGRYIWLPSIFLYTEILLDSSGFWFSCDLAYTEKLIPQACRLWRLNDLISQLSFDLGGSYLATAPLSKYISLPSWRLLLPSQQQVDLAQDSQLCWQLAPAHVPCRGDLGLQPSLGRIIFSLICFVASLHVCHQISFDGFSVPVLLFVDRPPYPLSHLMWFHYCVGWFILTHLPGFVSKWPQKVASFAPWDILPRDSTFHILVYWLCRETSKSYSPDECIKAFPVVSGSQR